MIKFFAKIEKHKSAYILKTMLDIADCADFGCHNSIRLDILVRTFKFGMWVYMGNATNAIVL